MAQVVELMHRDLFSHVNHDNHKFICAQKSSFTMKFHNHFKTKQSSLKLCYKIKMFLYLEIFYLIFKLLNETPRYHKCKHVTKIWFMLINILHECKILIHQIQVIVPFALSVII
jgi:hypothetical protein